MTDDKIKSIKHSAGAAIFIIVVFMLCIYVVAPITHKLLIIFGTYFVPERYGGGTLADESFLLRDLVRLVLTIYLAFYVAYSFAAKFFNYQSKKITFTFVFIYIALFAIFTFAWSNTQKNKKSYTYSSNNNKQSIKNIEPNNSASYNPSTILFTVIDNCDDGYDIQYKFIDMFNDLYWPSKDQVYITRGFNVPESINLTCAPNAIVCFGARSIGTQFSWGLGLDFNSTEVNELSTSCFLCRNVHESTQRMTCNSNTTSK